MHHLARALEVANIVAHQCDHAAVVLIGTACLKGVLMKQTHERTPSHDLQAVDSVLVGRGRDLCVVVRLSANLRRIGGGGRSPVEENTKSYSQADIRGRGFDHDPVPAESVIILVLGSRP